LAEDALALICASADALGLPAEVDRTISSIPNHSLACCVLYRYVRTRFGPLAALRNLVDIGAFPIPQQLVNEVLQWAIQRQGRGEADGAAEVLDRAIAGSLATDMRPAERDLMRGCEIIVAELRETLARRR
jgi:hypothetical protein